MTQRHNNEGMNDVFGLQSRQSSWLAEQWPGRERGEGGGGAIINSCRIIWKMQVVFKFFSTDPMAPSSHYLSSSGARLWKSAHFPGPSHLIHPSPASISCCFIAQIEKAMGKVRPSWMAKGERKQRLGLTGAGRAQTEAVSRNIIYVAENKPIKSIDRNTV